jgi:hypothetical protein
VWLLAGFLLLPFTAWQTVIPVASYTWEAEQENPKAL